LFEGISVVGSKISTCRKSKEDAARWFGENVKIYLQPEDHAVLVTGVESFNDIPVESFTEIEDKVLACLNVDTNIFDFDLSNLVWGAFFAEVIHGIEIRRIW
jgi:hypothetical protein